MTNTKVCFIINPRSGSKGKEHYEADILRTINRSKIDVSIRYTDAPQHATTIAAQCAKEGYDIVVAVGGDGSVNETGAGLIGTNTALGIIPTGSGNGMARHLKIPVNFIKAVDVLNRCSIELIDSISVNGRFCIGTIGVGFDAYIAHLFSKAGSRGYSTYVKLVLTEFSKYPGKDYTIELDGQLLKQNCFLLTFANSSQFGNNAVIAPFADVKDGIIDISMMNKFPAYVAPSLIYRLLHNNIHNSKYFTGYKAKEITIKNPNTLEGHIDGEPVLFDGDIKIKMLAQSISVVVPNTI